VVYTRRRGVAIPSEKQPVLAALLVAVVMSLTTSAVLLIAVGASRASMPDPGDAASVSRTVKHSIRTGT
jgi:hypothetical protein